MIHSNSRFFFPANVSLEVMLDGSPVPIPPERRTLAAIRTYLETLAMERQRVLCSFCVDGLPLDSAESITINKSFARIEGATIDLAQMPLQILSMAMQQTAQAQTQVQAAITLVLINEPAQAREHWWNLAQVLKQPLLTLSLMPEFSIGSANGTASFMQLRKWQLQQLAAIIKDVDDAGWSEDPLALSNALERRVLPWLRGLQTSFELWRETMLAAESLRTEPPPSLSGRRNSKI